MGKSWKPAWLWVSIMLLFTGCQNKNSEIARNLDLGYRYLEGQEYEEAVIAFSRCIEVDPKWQEALLGRAEAYMGMEQWEEAVSDCRAVIQLNEEDVSAYLLLGNILRGRIQHWDAMTETEYWDLMELMQRKRDNKTVESVILEIEEMVSTIPSSYFAPGEGEEHEYGAETGKSGSGEHTLWGGKIQVVEPPAHVEKAESFPGGGELKLLYVLKKEEETDHFEIQEIHVDGEKHYVLIYYSQWENGGYKASGEYQAVLHEDGRIRSVLKGTEDANGVGENGLNTDGQKVYDVDGNELFQVTDYWISGRFYHGLCRIRDKDTGLFGYVNTKGEVAIPCQYDNTKGFEGGAAYSLIGGEGQGWGYINAQGERILDERYDFMGNGTEKGLFCVRDRESGRWGYVDAFGEFVIPCVYENAFPFHGNPGEKNFTAMVFFDGRKMMIDHQGNDVLGEEYELTGDSYEYGLFAVRQKKTGFYGYADSRGTIRIPCMYDEVLEVSMNDGIAKVRSGEEEFWVDRNNQKTEPVKREEEELYEWNFMVGGGQYAEGDTYYVVRHNVYNWGGEIILEGADGSSIVVIDGTDFYYDDGTYMYVYRYEERDDT